MQIAAQSEGTTSLIDTVFEILIEWVGRTIL